MNRMASNRLHKSVQESGPAPRKEPSRLPSRLPLTPVLRPVELPDEEYSQGTISSGTGASGPSHSHVYGSRSFVVHPSPSLSTSRSSSSSKGKELKSRPPAKLPKKKQFPLDLPSTPSSTSSLSSEPTDVYYSPSLSSSHSPSSPLPPSPSPSPSPLRRSATSIDFDYAANVQSSQRLLYHPQVTSTSELCTDYPPYAPCTFYKPLPSTTGPYPLTPPYEHSPLP